MKNSVLKTEARFVIGAVLTLGFVTVNIFTMIGFVEQTIYVTMMQWYVPLQAVVIGFYFGTAKSNGQPPIVSIDPLERIVQDIGVMVNQIQTIAAAYTTLTEQVAGIEKRLEAQTGD
jgi:hypothetical protein